MSQKSEKKLRRMARKILRVNWDKFYDEISQYKFADRWKMAWALIRNRKRNTDAAK